MVENGEEMVLLPLPPAGTADREIVPAYVGVSSANRSVDSNATAALFTCAAAAGGILAQKNLNFGRLVEPALVKAGAERKWPRLPIDQLAEGNGDII
jgi:hypothetical protein